MGYIYFGINESILYSVKGDEACQRFPSRDYNGKRQIKVGAKMETLLHNGVKMACSVCVLQSIMSMYI